jgi:predicted ATPase with chaperone activity
MTSHPEGTRPTPAPEAPELRGEAEHSQHFRFQLAFGLGQLSSAPLPVRNFSDPTRECRCTGAIIQRYLSKISVPLLDRIDLHVEVPAVPYNELRGKADGRGSATRPHPESRANHRGSGRARIGSGQTFGRSGSVQQPGS